MRLFTTNIIELCDRHHLHSEIVIVEWNPPDGPRLHDVLEPLKKSAYVSIRFVEVPPELHESFPNSEKLPLFQMIAKNVGIRRARGDFVIATNHDILFSDALISTLATAKLDPDCVYRVDRTDVAAEVPEMAQLDDQLAWCKEHILRVHRRRGTFNGPPYWELDWFLSPGLSLLARHLRSFPARVVRSVVRGISGWIARLLKFRLGKVFPYLRYWISKFFFVLWKVTSPKPKLHTNACGDFTMLARHHWLALRGYPEVPLYSLHIDSFFCCVASAAGLREHTFRAPRRLYHLEHSTSWAALDAEERVRWFTRLPWLEWRIVEALWEKMRRDRRPFLYNDDAWGFGTHELPEVVIRDGNREFMERSPAVVTGS